MRLEPRTRPSAVVTSEPFAWDGKAACATIVMAAGETTPVLTVSAIVRPTAGQSWRRMRFIGRLLCESQRRDDDVDELDADEGRDDAAEPIDEQVAAKQLARRRRAEADATERERDERGDDQRVEDD